MVRGHIVKGEIDICIQRRNDVCLLAAKVNCCFIYYSIYLNIKILFPFSRRRATLIQDDHKLQDIY